MAESILQKRKECYICRHCYNLVTVDNLERHHVFDGAGRRELSDRFGLTVWLCHRHHNEPPGGVHFNAIAMANLQSDAARMFDMLHGDGSCQRIFGKNFKDDNDDIPYR